MIFTNKEMEQLQTTLESQSGLDEALLERCGPMIHMGKFAEAVRSAFVLLEEDSTEKRSISPQRRRERKVFSLGVSEPLPLRAFAVSFFSRLRGTIANGR